MICKSRKFTKVFLLTCLIGSILQLLFIDSIEAVAGETLWKTADIIYNANSDNLKKSHSSVFYKEKTVESKPFSLDAGSGKIITKIVLKKDGVSYQEPIIVNSQKYTNKITLNGQGVPVKSTDNEKNGSWFSWERGSRDVHWKPGDGDNYTIGAITTPGSDTSNGFSRDMWPGRFITQVVSYTRANPYVSVGSVDYGQFATKYIDDSTETLLAANPFQNGINVSKSINGEVITPTGVSGPTDPTTTINGMKVLNLDKAEIEFTQDHGHEGERVNLGTPGAAMMYYFAFYRYDIKTFTYRYPDTYEVYVKDGDGEDTPGGAGSCTWTIQPPSQIAAPQTISMDPKATGVIKADDPSNSPYSFDVGQGIPTSDYLYANTLGLNYLFQHTFGNQVGKINYDCSVDLTYVLTWKEKQDDIIGADGEAIPQDDKEMSETEDKNYSFSFTRDYDYWTINHLEVYIINKAIMSNYALPSGTVTLNPTGYIPPTLETKQSDPVGDHVYPKETGTISFTPPIQDGGYSRPSPDDHSGLLLGMAESQTQDAEVQNDKVNFNGEIIMKDDKVIKKAPTPGKIPESPMIGNRVLYMDNQLIIKTLINKANTPSSGTIFYDLLDGHVGGSGGKDFPINNINTVTVHTPVVNYSSVTDDEEHNQKTNPNYNRAAFILERPFTVRIPTEGQHVNYPGYGDRDYAKYYRTKQVWFPFDVYNGSRTQFIPKNTWIDIPVNQLDTAFYLPVWVDEGNYQVLLRNIAENAPADFDVQPDANTELRNHVATDEISVEVIGRLYDFHITDIVDYNWETVFRTRKGSLQQTGISYWVGMNSIDGDPRGNDSKFTVPILPGSHPIQGFKNVAIKQGYHYKFDFKTKGNMFGPTDGIRITPTFNYVSKDGTMTTPVDLYYHASDKNFVKIGSNDDQVKRYVLMNERMRNVPNEELTDTAEFKYRNYYTSGQLINTSMNQFVENYINKSTKQKTPVGGYDLLLLPEQLRTFIGPKSSIPSSVNTDRALAAIQHWYGEYSIPADTYVVKQGIKLYQNGPFDEKASMFLKDGYIVVNFNIESIQQGDLANPHLQYINAPLMNKVVNGVQRNNQWRMEGFNHNIQDSYGNRFHLIDGDVVFYNADKSSRDDFGSQVPH
ncbi:hypothetical protein J2T13_004581 [Paenibacillus sp. DS2015]|uniref:DUF5704 domain-containing protein n=1 Tax=Paenibacillus sp. DS2015 TaxID=3373917 RepID=UPI003D1B1C04